MSRAALYRLYRPQNFDEVEGQQHIAVTLRNASKERQFAQAYLFTGTRGTGKTSMARIVAKAINCLSPLADGNPCNLCTSCLSATAGKLVDIIEIDAASNNSVEQMRELTDRSRFLPAQADKKIYIIDEVHMLSSSAFNALLKTLEEPPEHVHFILATTEQHKVLPTIISRCQVFHFLPLTHAEITTRLQYVAKEEGISLDDEALQTIAYHAKGGMRDALSILERLMSGPEVLTKTYINQILGVASDEAFDAIYQCILQKDVSGALEHLEQEQNRGTAPEKFIRGFKNALRTRMLLHAKKHGMDRTATHLLKLIDRLESSLAQVKYADIPWLHCELGILDACTLETTPDSIAVPKAAKQSPVSSQAAVVPKAISPRPVVEKPLSTAPEAPKKQETPATTDTDNEDAVRFGKLQKEWTSFSFKIADPVIRTALKSTKPTGFSEGTLTLACQSSVQLAHLGQVDALKLVQDALVANYGLKAEINIQLAATPSALKTPPAQEPPEQTEEAPVSKEEQVLKIADLFGGSIINS